MFRFCALRIQELVEVGFKVARLENTRRVEFGAKRNNSTPKALDKVIRDVKLGSEKQAFPDDSCRDGQVCHAGLRSWLFHGADA